MSDQVNITQDGDATIVVLPPGQSAVYADDDGQQVINGVLVVEQTPGPKGQQERLAKNVADKIADLEEPVVGLVGYTRNTRAMVWWLIASVAFDILLSVVVAVFAVQAKQAAENASDAKNAVHTACEARNQFKALDLQRWGFIIAQSDQIPPTGTPAEQEEQAQRVKDFQKFIAEADKPETCD